MNKRIISLTGLSIITLAFLISCATTSPKVEDLLKEPLPGNTTNIPEDIYKTIIGDITKARENIAQNKETYDSYISLGNSYRNFKALEKSYAFYDKATQVSPNSGIVAWLNRSTALEDMGKYEEAKESYLQTIKLFTYPQAYFRLGIIHRQYLKSPDKEIRTFYTEAMTNTTYDTAIVTDYIGYLLEQKDQKEADAVLAKALEKQPDNPKFKELKQSYNNL